MHITCGFYTDKRISSKTWLYLSAQGLDALGLATFDYVTSVASSRLPLAVSLASSSIDDDDVTNLRTLRRLLLLLSRLQNNENSTTVR